MRYFAVMLLLAAMGAAGYLAWTGLHQTPEVIPSGEVKTVRVCLLYTSDAADE